MNIIISEDIRPEPNLPAWIFWSISI